MKQIPMWSSKKQLKDDDFRVFGVSLNDVMKRPHETECVPLFLIELIRELKQYINIEGLFCQSASPTEMKALKDKIEKGNRSEIQTVKDGHLLAGVLKSYIAELPDPLLTFKLYDDFVQTCLSSQNQSNMSTMDEKIRKLVGGMPVHHKAVLEFIFFFLTKVIKKSNENKLGAAQLGVVFGPLILRPKKEEDEALAIMAATRAGTVFCQHLLMRFVDVFQSYEKGRMCEMLSPRVGSRSMTVPPSALLSVSSSSSQIRTSSSNDSYQKVDQSSSLTFSEPTAIDKRSPESSLQSQKAKMLVKSTNRGLVRYGMANTVGSTTSSVSPPAEEAVVTKGGRVYYVQAKDENPGLKKLQTDLQHSIKLVQAQLEDLAIHAPNETSEERLIVLQKKLESMASILSSSGAEQPITSIASDSADGQSDSASLATTSGFESLKGPRKTMEDAHVIFNCLNPMYPLLGLRSSFYAVYDGHAGVEAALLAKEHFHKILMSQPAILEGSIQTAIKEAYRKTDERILQASRDEGWRAGCTAAVSFLVGNTLYSSNVGDAESIIVSLSWRRRTSAHTARLTSNLSDSLSSMSHPLIPSEYTADGASSPKRDEPTKASYYLLTLQHKLTIPEEKNRIRELGGIIMGDRLFGDLAIARALGDAEYKKPISEQDYISAEPYMCEPYVLKHRSKWPGHDLASPTHSDYETGTDGDEDDVDSEDVFMIVACDGLWDVMTYKYAMDYVLEESAKLGVRIEEIADKLIGVDDEHAKKLSSLLANKALELGSTDNVSVVVVFFNWKAPTAKSQRQRRSHRQRRTPKTISSGHSSANSPVSSPRDRSDSSRSSRRKSASVAQLPLLGSLQSSSSSIMAQASPRKSSRESRRSCSHPTESYDPSPVDKSKERSAITISNSRHASSAELSSPSQKFALSTSPRFSSTSPTNAAPNVVRERSTAVLGMAKINYLAEIEGNGSDGQPSGAVTKE
eukprot:TRINITY_DN3129_c0_g1_i1.p1 TRINITY_DN3129_c0_g1~~TRINITY_DN3129_c0_g1_i1.p1  ORF type:complete len:968 (-),score=294.91 TRINITY_DN3129_c0_g1_i1:9-2912(-)